MDDKEKKISYTTLNEVIELFIEFVQEKNKKAAIYEFINKEPVDYQGLYSIFHLLDSDDVSLILKYDKDYSISFLLTLVDLAYEEDLTKQALYLLKRYNLNYILPLLPYVDEEVIRNEYRKKAS